jgi:zinc transport system substrate-binding protein
MYSHRALVAVLGAGALALITGCSGSATGDSTSAGSPDNSDGKLVIATSFYPLHYVTERIAGDRATVRNLTPPGVEPHDLELAPQDVALISDADLVIYLSGFQDAVDEAVDGEAEGSATDVTTAAKLDQTAAEEGETGADPHFWLDPKRLIAVSTLIQQRLTEKDAAGAATYAANLSSLSIDLDTLDDEFRAGLASCTSKNLVTSHQAFGYLAAQYGLTQVGITGLSPDEEPNPATLARVTDFVRTNKVRTIYYETLLNPAIARTVASETGARTLVLDPIEGITDQSQGIDYFMIMRSNLENLKEGQPCP